MKWLATQIKQLQCILDNKVHCINCGGCMYFAYYFSEKLKELNIDHKFVITHCQPIDIRRGKSDGFNHVMIFIPGIGYIDGESTYTTLKDYKSRLYYRHFRLTKSKIETLLKERCWNNDYDKRQNKTVLANINKYIHLPNG